jgi:hypothetical protein
MNGQPVVGMYEGLNGESFAVTLVTNFNIRFSIEISHLKWHCVSAQMFFGGTQ